MPKKAERSASTGVAGGAVCETDQDTTCTVCYAEFLDPDDLEVHIQQMHPSGKLVNCQFCEKILTDAECYMLHVRDVHILDFISCFACNRIFTHSADLRRHENKHPRSMREGTYACSQCGQFFLYRTELQQHELENHYDDEGVYLNNHFALLSSVINMNADVFIKSVRNEHDKMNFFYNCARCKYRNVNLEAYIMHLKKFNCRSVACDKCCKVFKSKAALVGHVKRHCNIRELIPSKIKPKQCTTCKKYFDPKKIKSHDCTPCLKCCNCDSIFETMYELSEHQSSAHPLAVLLTVCQFCRKECVGTVSLEKHIQRSHEHEFHLYKYTCSYCDTNFKHPQRLFAHFFLKHKDIEPYLCKICDKKFRIRKAFTLHIKLQHKSEGFVEFDERLHVFFTNKKSQKPFQPVSKFIKEKPADENGEDKDKEAEDKSHELQLKNMESDVYPTETDGNQTDAKETKETAPRSRKRKVNRIAKEVMELSDCDSDDEPLLVIKKKARLKLQLRKKPLINSRKRSKMSAKKQFTCEICKKYCYTFQNYQNHVNMHFKDETKKCVKCSLAFKTKPDLQRHMTEEHSSSRLTETLKNILERRKKGEKKQEMTETRKFLNTIKKVAIEKDDVIATIQPINKELSVQKFIESFTPEGEVKNIQVHDSISLTKVTNPVEREPVIKMTKFKPAPEIHESLIKLSMPVKFKRSNEVHSVSVKKVQAAPIPSKINIYYDDGNQFQDDDNYEDTKETNIPEAEQEVTLEGTEEAPKRTPATHKIVIPKLPKELKSIRIAHLLPEAPYYKIVKMADIMKQNEEKEAPVKKEPQAPPAEVRMPDGTKLVHVNPLAHLLGNTPVEQIVKTSKYYKPSSKNFEEVLANALMKLESPRNKRKKGEKIVRQEIQLPEKSAPEEVESNGHEKTECNGDDCDEKGELNNDVQKDDEITTKESVEGDLPDLQDSALNDSGENVEV